MSADLAPAAHIYLILGFILLWLYAKKLDKLHRGFFFGTFLLCCFGVRFLIEFVKEESTDFSFLGLNTGQVLSIPFILLGIGVLIWSGIKKKPAAAVHPAPAPKEQTHYAKPLR